MTYSQSPSIQTHWKESDGSSWVQIKASVFNRGPGVARSVRVQATAVYCSNPYEPKNGGFQQLPVNVSIPAGGKADVTLQVRVHGFNDTSITVETLIGKKVEVIGYIKTPRPVFLRNVGITDYETSFSGKEANVSVQVFNDGSLKPSGSIKVVASSYTSYNARVESNEILLDRSLPNGDTWSFTVQLKVSELDLGHPSFAVELFEGQNANPSDTAYFDG